MGQKQYKGTLMCQKKTNALTRQTRLVFEGRSRTDVGHQGNPPRSSSSSQFRPCSFTPLASPEKTSVPKEYAKSRWTRVEPDRFAWCGDTGQQLFAYFCGESAGTTSG